MTEQEYINVRDITNIANAINSLTDISLADQRAISPDDFSAIIMQLRRWQIKIRDLVQAANDRIHGEPLPTNTQHVLRTRCFRKNWIGRMSVASTTRICWNAETRCSRDAVLIPHNARDNHVARLNLPLRNHVAAAVAIASFIGGIEVRAMTDGINDRRPMKPISGPVLEAWLVLLSEMPHCETCERTYLDATCDEIFYRCEPEGLVRCCECLRREKWDV